MLILKPFWKWSENKDNVLSGKPFSLHHLNLKKKKRVHDSTNPSTKKQITRETPCQRSQLTKAANSLTGHDILTDRT